MPEILSTVSGVTSVGKSVFEFLNGILKWSRDYDKEFFTQHIEPLQKQMEAIHKDYRTAFAEARRHVKDSSQPPHALLDFLRERRKDYESERQMTKALALGLKEAGRQRKKHSEQVESYCAAVMDYFTAGARAGGATGISWFTDLLDMVETKMRLAENFERKEGIKPTNMNVWFTTSISGNIHGDLIHCFDDLVDRELPAAYQKICNNYGTLRAAML